ncbi:MAG: DUF6644 family protein [Candidatus Solibacter sp.]|jgi:hypothetical protein
MSLLPLFQWAAHAPIFAVMRDSKWGFAVVEMVHLLALACLGGTVLVVDLGILGIGLRRLPASFVARDLSRLFLGSLILTGISGTLLITAEAMKCYYHPAFRLKMLLFVLALALHFALNRRLSGVPEDTAPTAGLKLVAAVSLALWLSVGLAGRAIGFF